MNREAIDIVLEMKREQSLSAEEFMWLLPHKDWSPETCANMIAQMRRVEETGE